MQSGFNYVAEWAKLQRGSNTFDSLLRLSISRGSVNVFFQKANIDELWGPLANLTQQLTCISCSELVGFPACWRMLKPLLLTADCLWCRSGKSHL